jgi:hypothetical protein
VVGTVGPVGGFVVVGGEFVGLVVEVTVVGKLNVAGLV